MSADVPFAIRRSETIEKAIAIFSADSRFLAGWLEGSLADNSADSFSDIDCIYASPRVRGRRFGRNVGMS